MLFPVLSRDGFGGSLSKEGPEVGGPTGEEEPGRVQRDGFLGFSFKDRPLILNTAGAIPGTMRETLLIISDSEAATTAVLKGATFAFAPDAVAPSLRELLHVGSRSRCSSFVHHRPSERERTQSAPKLESEVST